LGVLARGHRQRPHARARGVCVRTALRRDGRLSPLRREREDHPGDGRRPEALRPARARAGPLHGLARDERDGEGVRRRAGAVIGRQEVSARLAVHYRGTVACPYHGWVFDDGGKNVAVLSEGPDSGVCGKPGTEARVYPTRTLKGVVFVWIGHGDPAPIEEDVPEEFFDPDALVLTGEVTWRCNWEV